MYLKTYFNGTSPRKGCWILALVSFIAITPARAYEYDYLVCSNTIQGDGPDQSFILPTQNPIADICIQYWKDVRESIAGSPYYTGAMRHVFWDPLTYVPNEYCWAEVETINGVWQNAGLLTYCEYASNTKDQSSKNEGPPKCPSGNPVNTATGNKYQLHVDYASGDNSPLKLERSYNSKRFAPSSFGLYWIGTYDRSLYSSAARDRSTSQIVNDAAVTLYRSDGKRYAFTLQEAGYTANEPNVIGRLEKTTNEWRYVSKDDVTEIYDLEGRLISITDRLGRAQSLSYNTGDQLTNVTDSHGNQLIFTYDALDRVATMTDAEGDVYHYGYDANGNLISIAYPDATPGDLSDNPTRQYLYEDTRFPHALTGIIDENNERYATWTYDDQGRAISSTHATGADNTTLAYNVDGTTTVTNALGKQTTYHFDVIHGVYKVTQVEGHPTANCAGANKNYTYDVNGFLSSKTDWNGNVTTYVHDARGLETSRAEGSGTPQARTITTEWHTDFRVPVRITEPDKITEFTYDTNGRLLSKQERSTP